MHSLTRAVLSSALAVALLLSFGCRTPERSGDISVIGTVITKSERDQLSPDEIVQRLLEGNRRFTSDNLTHRDHSKQVRDAVSGQHPKAIILSCVDSRVPVEDVFDRGIGDVFVARVAGNFENTDILGSMEYACRVAGSKVIFVLGHEHCGAVKAAVDGVELGNITPLLENIQPAVAAFKSYVGKRTSKNAEFVHMVAEQNVRNTIRDIRTRSPILAAMEKDGNLRFVGGIYDMSSGRVDVLQ